MIARIILFLLYGIFYSRSLFAFGPMAYGSHISIDSLSEHYRITWQIKHEHAEIVSPPSQHPLDLGKILTDTPFYINGKECVWADPVGDRIGSTYVIQASSFCATGTIQSFRFNFPFLEGMPPSFLVYLNLEFDLQDLPHTKKNFLLATDNYTAASHGDSPWEMFLTGVSTVSMTIDGIAHRPVLLTLILIALVLLLAIYMQGQNKNSRIDYFMAFTLALIATIAMLPFTNSNFHLKILLLSTAAFYLVPPYKPLKAKVKLLGLSLMAGSTVAELVSEVASYPQATHIVFGALGAISGLAFLVILAISLAHWIKVKKPIHTFVANFGVNTLWFTLLVLVGFHLLS